MVAGEAQRQSLKITPVVESDSFEFLRYHAVAENILTFQIPVGLSEPTRTGRMVSRPLDVRDIPAGTIHMAQLRGRTLPVAAARFAAQLAGTLATSYEAV